VIILQKLIWDNCFSYGKGNEIDLATSTLTQLVGTNGVGKSSIPLILEEVLFNKNSKNVKKADIANRYVNNGYDITLEFAVDGDSYVLTVIRRNTLKCKLTRNGEDISSHTASNTYKTLGEILGIDFKTFTQLVYQNTNTSLQFLTATDTNRKKFLIELLKLDDYVAYFETFKDAVRSATQEITILNAKTDTIVKWLTDNKLETTTLLSKVDLPKIEEKDEKELRSLLLEIENISEKNRRINDNNNLADQLNSIDIDTYKRNLEKYPIERATSEYQNSIGAWDHQVSNREDLIVKYTELGEAEDAACPTCEQPISKDIIASKKAKAEDELEWAIGNLNNIKTILKETQNENEIYRESAKGVRDWEGLFRSIDRGLPKRVLNQTSLESQVRALQDKVENARTTLEEVIDENNRRERYNTRIEIIGEQTTNFENELTIITSNLGRIEDKLSILEILKKAFSTNGLLAYKIESLVKELEDLTNEYLAEFSDGRFSINFVVENDKLNVEVTDNAKIIDILALSSGELARVNIATLVAIRKLMTSISRSQINVLFLDEVNQALDEAGKEKIVEILLKEEDLNTFLVSHGWTHPLLEKIEILKDDNISHLE
tara:strand:+ start:2651 stop:4465 length:1815 start_codon:yes stop_codon:yes gene_type:complete